MTQKSQAEPSMDDILASIRKIIAEDPQSTEPVASPAQAMQPTPGSLSARLNDVFGPAAPLASLDLPKPMPMSVRDAFEDDLGGLVAPVAPKPVAQKPSASAPTSVTTTSADKATLSRVATGPSTVPTATISPAPVEPSPVIAPIVQPVFSQASAPPAGPAKPSAPVVIAAMPATATAAAASPNARPISALDLSSLSPVGRFVEPAPVQLPEAAQGSKIETSSAGAGTIAASAPPLFPSSSTATVVSTVEASPAAEPALASLRSISPSDVAVKPAPVVIAATTAVPAPLPPFANGRAGPVSNTPAPAVGPKETPKATALEVGKATLTAASTASTDLKPGDGTAQQANDAPKKSVPDVSATLSGGGNAAASGGAPVGGTTIATTAVSTPPPPAVIASSAALPVPTAALEPMPVDRATELRAMVPSDGHPELPSNFDDTAAELLRPMLRQWIDSNMPRIVEKALRRELAQNPPEALHREPEDGAGV